MAYLKINHDKIDASAMRALMELCPFKALSEENGKLTVGAGCRMCKLCVRKGPAGAVEFVDDAPVGIDKSLWRDITVYVEHDRKTIHPVTFELIGKALELAKVTGQKVNALFIGSGIPLEELLTFGVDTVYAYDEPQLADFNILPYAAAFEDYINKTKPSAILVGATNAGRALAPRIAARFHTGLTADCTVLDMKKNTDLVQIRPAFGGNIMAQIITPRTRPQLCTVRYKVFSAPQRSTPHGSIRRMSIAASRLNVGASIIEIIDKPAEVDISEADAIVAVGRGLKSKADIALAQKLADAMGAQLACTRPLVEAGWFDPRRQIGLSGRTVKPKVIVTLGISGSVQFAAGMKNSDCIIAVNSDPHAAIFDIAHHGFVGDIYDIVPGLIEQIGGK